LLLDDNPIDLLEVCDHERFNIASKSDSETEDEEVLDKYTKAFSRNNKVGYKHSIVRTIKAKV